MLFFYTELVWLAIVKTIVKFRQAPLSNIYLGKWYKFKLAWFPRVYAAAGLSDLL